MNSKGIAVGLDFGSTRTRVSYFNEGAYRSLPALPSYIAFDQARGKLLVGQEAKAAFHSASSDAVCNLKAAVLRDQRFRMGGESFLAVSLVSQLLRTLVLQVQETTGRPVESAVMTVPVFFTQVHKAALRDAAIISGLKRVKIISQPSAALISYRQRLRRQNTSFTPRTVLLLDTGGLTTDATICRVSEDRLSVKKVYGNNKVGAYMVDDALGRTILGHLTEACPNPSPSEVRTCAAIAEGLKISFSGGDATVSVSLGSGTHAVSLTGLEIEDAFRDYLESVVSIYQRVSSQVEGGIQEVLLIGGPFESQYIRGYVGSRMKERRVSYPDHGFIVSKGAAIHAYGLMTNETTRLQDVVPMPIGVESQGGYFSIIIPANAPCPSSHNRMFTTTQDNQSTLTFRIYQGSRMLVRECAHIGTVTLKGLQPELKGVPQIKATLSIDEEGLLGIRLEDLSTGVTQEASISAHNRLNAPRRDEQVKVMKRYRQQHLDLLSKLTLADMARNWLAELDRRGVTKTHPLHDRLIQALHRVPLDYNELEIVVSDLQVQFSEEQAGLPTER